MKLRRYISEKVIKERNDSFSGYKRTLNKFTKFYLLSRLAPIGPGWLYIRLNYSVDQIEFNQQKGLTQCVNCRNNGTSTNLCSGTEVAVGRKKHPGASIREKHSPNFAIHSRATVFVGVNRKAIHIRCPRRGFRERSTGNFGGKICRSAVSSVKLLCIQEGSEGSAKFAVCLSVGLFIQIADKVVAKLGKNSQRCETRTACFRSCNGTVACLKPK